MNFDWPWSSTKTHKCPDGTIRIIYKNIDDAFPLELKEHTSAFGADINVQKQATAKLKAEYQSKIKGLLFSIGEHNQSLMMTLRSAYVGFASDPCNDGGFYKRQVEAVQVKQHKLIELKTQISGLITLAETFSKDPERIMNAYMEIMNDLSGKALPQMAAKEIRENADAAKQWIGGEHA